MHYLAHFAVLNPGSFSTSLRVVADSAFLNIQAKLSLSDFVKTGPNALHNILHMILGWRSYQHSVMYDLKHAYHK